MSSKDRHSPFCHVRPPLVLGNFLQHFPLSNCCSFELVIRDGLGSACFLSFFFSRLSKEEEEEEGSRIV
jgi:hypothetical protein